MAEEVVEPQAQNEAVEPDTTEVTSPVTETQTEVSTETDSPAAEEVAVEETEVEAERKPSRAERRIKELNGQVRQLQQQDQLPQGLSTPPQFDLMQYTDIDGNVDVQAANQAANSSVVQAAQSIADLTVRHQLAQDRAVQSVERDSEALPTKYAELNPSSPNYSPELEQAITEEFQEKAFRVTGYNPKTGQPVYALDPNVRLANVAERYMKAVNAVATKSSANTRNAVQASADTNGIRPGGDTKADRPFEELSIAEMEAKLGNPVRR